MVIDVATARPGFLDHRRQPGGLGFERRDLAIHPIPGVKDQRASLIGVLRGLQALAVALAGELVLQELADLGEREPSVVTQALDEPESLEVARVVQTVRPV